MEQPDPTTGTQRPTSPPLGRGGATELPVATADPLDDPELAVAGSLVAAFMQAGVTITAAIDDIGYAAISSNADLVTLAAIRLDGPLRPSIITDRTGLTSGGTTNLLHRLEAAGYVHRTTDGVDDGRGILVELTAAGRMAIEAIGDLVATQLLASRNTYDLIRDCFVTTGRPVPVFPRSITDTATQLRDVLRLAETGRYITELLDSVMHDTTSSRSAMTLWLAAAPGHVRPGRLAELTGLSSAGVSELLIRLEERDLVTRASGRPPDRRAVVVETTPTGRALLARALAVVAAHLDQIEARINAD